MSEIPTPTEKDVIDYGLLANFVHQVINPLNGVSGTLDNIAEGVVPQNRIEQRLRAARAQVEQSILLIRNLAFISEVSSDPSKADTRVAKKTCVIPQVIIEAAMFFQELGLSKGIRIHLQDRETQYKVEGNPDLLRQVFMNLFDNCVKYGQKGTDIVINPRVQKKSNSLLIEITGRSFHISPAEWEKIFEIRYRTEAAQDMLSAGTGLGLFICQQILRRIHGGSIEVSSSTQAGDVTFLLRFPKFWI